MILYTLDKIKRNQDQGYLYDLFDTKIIPKSYTNTIPYYVKDEDSMRLDLICQKIYGHVDYLDELCTLNNIINPFSLKTGDIILIFEPQSALTLYVEDEDNTDQYMSLVNSSKETRSDPNRKKKDILDPNQQNIVRPPTIKPKNLKTINIDQNQVKIIDSLE